ncbi:MAG: hypothetical protein MSG64_08325 [Pyrinomonadaceae bacterium MAG19_C2-C3]|nr:hypothetical protein [Pyrinomonadaceae bacterium MAG19_C2-C3]
MNKPKLNKRKSNQCRTNQNQAATRTTKKKSSAQGFLIAGTSLALLFGIAFLKGRADEPQGKKEQAHEGE